MGKRQHQKDKMYLTTTEWTSLYGGKRAADNASKSRSEFKRLPFDHCALSLQTFEHPLCTNDGVIYDLLSIVPFLKKYGVDPATGKPLDAKSLIRLKFSKNADGKYHCPVLFKVFNGNSHIVAIKTTGNVFSYEAVEQLNIKAKHYKDLLNDEPFTREDIITLQDPTNLEKFNFSNYHHIKNKLKLTDPEEQQAKSDPRYKLKSISNETKEILNELDRDYKPSAKKEESKRKADKFNAAHYSTGAVAASSTSTIMAPSTQLEAAVLGDDVVRYSRVKKKGYVQLQTTHGNLNLELYCDAVAKTCENFIKLADKGYYDNTVFHRSIKNFMIQGGDPTGTGKGGESIWGKAFKDEFKPNFIHQGRGVLSMANSGPNTNKSQFFITFRSCRHLDNKHSVFGRVVGGLETLNVMESVETDNKDRPIEDVTLLKAVVFINPFQEADEQLIKEREEEKIKNETVEKSSKPKASETLKVYHSGVGKYINPNQKTSVQVEAEEPKRKKKVVFGGFGDFSSW